MPRPPHFAARVDRLEASVFEQFAPLLRAHEEPFLKLHIGDADMRPPYELPFTPGFLDENPYALQYANTWGVRRLREAIREKMAEDNGIDLPLDGVLVTAGASNALSATAHTLFEGGDEVLILTPAWPFFFGMVRMTGATVRELPLYTRLAADPELDLEALLDASIGDRTVAIYVNSPNNPSGVVLPRSALDVVARAATRHNLWILADEAYDGLVLEGETPSNLGAREELRERTLSMFTFSKAFLTAGQRLGWVAGAPEVVKKINKVMVHQVYGPNVPAQMMMISPLRTRHEWLERVRSVLLERRDAFCDVLDLGVERPPATYFLFLDLTAWQGRRSAQEIVESCVREGVAVAPGGDFGRDFGNWIRVCFTADRPDRTCEGARRLRDILTGP